MVQDDGRQAGDLDAVDAAHSDERVGPRSASSNPRPRCRPGVGALASLPMPRPGSAGRRPAWPSPRRRVRRLCFGRGRQVDAAAQVGGAGLGRGDRPDSRAPPAGRARPPRAARPAAGPTTVAPATVTGPVSCRGPGRHGQDDDGHPARARAMLASVMGPSSRASGARVQLPVVDTGQLGDRGAAPTAAIIEQRRHELGSAHLVLHVLAAGAERDGRDLQVGRPGVEVGAEDGGATRSRRGQGVEQGHQRAQVRGERLAALTALVVDDVGPPCRRW